MQEKGAYINHDDTSLLLALGNLKELHALAVRLNERQREKLSFIDQQPVSYHQGAPCNGGINDGGGAGGSHANGDTSGGDGDADAGGGGGGGGVNFIFYVPVVLRTPGN
ncbi:conserved hypothetical protein [Ricinus communis]|uniref:Uncharacterized protein n=1 Tax=Ricinus communis TaxID=3988 RepID=B9RP15_RICCO|nr:conserved hypothetical protein [Ricinus communis]